MSRMDDSATHTHTHTHRNHSLSLYFLTKRQYVNFHNHNEIRNIYRNFNTQVAEIFFVI